MFAVNRFVYQSLSLVLVPFPNICAKHIIWSSERLLGSGPKMGQPYCSSSQPWQKLSGNSINLGLNEGNISEIPIFPSFRCLPYSSNLLQGKKAIAAWPASTRQAAKKGLVYLRPVRFAVQGSATQVKKANSRLKLVEGDRRCKNSWSIARFMIR